MVGVLWANIGIAQNLSYEIWITKIEWKGYSGDGYGPRIKIWQGQQSDSYPYLLTSNCIGGNNASSGTIYPNYKRAFYTAKDLVLIFHTFEKRKSNSDYCVAHDGGAGQKDDGSRVTQQISIDSYTDLGAGYFNDFSITNSISATNKVTIYYSLRYTPPRLNRPLGNSEANCSDLDYTLTTTLENAGVVKNLPGLSYKWEFNIQGKTYSNPDYSVCLDGCYDELQECLSGGGRTGGSSCYTTYSNCRTACSTSDPPQLPLWEDLETTPVPSITFNPLTKIFKGSLGAIQEVKFRVTPIGRELTGPMSSEATYRFVPPPPKATTVAVEPSCSQRSSGVMRVTGVTSQFATYRFVLKAGIVDALSCDPDKVGNCLDISDKSGSASGNNFAIPNLKSGYYTLFLLNNAGTEGFCPRRIGEYNVPLIPALRATISQLQNVSCNGLNQGSFLVTIADGLPSNVSYELVKNDSLTTKNSSQANAAVLFDNLSVGAYILTVNDNCSASIIIDNIAIRQPSKVSQVDSLEKSDASCNSPGNGYFKTTVSKSTGPFDVSSSSLYSYELWNGGSSPYLNIETTSATWSRGDLPIGNYELRVKEKNAVNYCNGFIQPFQINAPTPLAVNTLSVTDVRCFGGTDGEVNVTATGGAGVGKYGYELKRISDGAPMPSNTDGKFTTLLKDQYELTIKNSWPGCTDTFVRPAFISVGQPDSIRIDLSKTDITCYNARNGRIEATVSGGTPSYTYTWEKYIGTRWASISSNVTSTAATTSVTGLLDGQYRLRVVDAAALGGCEKISTTITIIEPDVLGISAVAVNDIACLGDTGTIEITPQGGTAPYAFAYTANNGATYTSFDANTPLPAGDYRVRVTDTRGCTFVHAATYKITDPPTALDFAFVQKTYGAFNISCFGGNNGEVAITASGGNGGTYSGYQYAWDGGSFSPTSIVTGITAGTRQISVKDGRGCIVTKSLDFTQPSAVVTLTALKQNVECFGAATGSIQLSTSGGVGIYRYSLGSVTNTTGLFTNLTAGNYSFAIADDNNCSIVYDETIVNLHPALTASAAVQAVSCFGGTDGKITLTLGGGLAPYQIKLNNTLVANPIANLTKGTYDFTIIDSRACSLPLTGVVVSQPDLLQITKVTTQDIECLGGTGKIDVAATGGTMPYVYEYSTNGGATFVPFTNATALVANTYSVRVKDANGCTVLAAQPSRITNPPATLDFTFVKSDYNGFNISCFGGNNGFAILSPTGGNGAGYSDYEFALDGGAFRSSAKLEFINAGNHTLSVRDARGCVVTKSTNFTQSPVAVSASVTRIKNVTCFNETNGEIEIGVTGGSAPYQYQIMARPYVDENTFTSLGVGSYVVNVKDNNNCPAQTTADIVSLNPAITVAETIAHVSCYDGNDGSIEIAVGGGVPSFSYSWKDLNATGNKISQLKKGAYSVKITDKAGCKVEASYFVKQPEAPLSINLASLPACWNQANGTVTATATGGTVPYQFAIGNGAFGAAPSFQKETGSHTVNVRDAKGCNAQATIAVGQKINEPKFNFLVATKQYALDTLVITDISVPKPDSIQWTFDPQAIVISKDLWAPQIKFNSEGTYWVETKSFFSGCGYVLRKIFDLKPYDPNAKPSKAKGYRTIESMDVSPNPSNGEFDLSIKLSAKSKLTVTIFDMLGVVQFTNAWEPTTEIKTKITLPNVASGIYMLRATAETDAKDVRLSINK